MTLHVTQGNSGLWFITSPDVPGLLVAGHSMEKALSSVSQRLQELKGAGKP